MADDSERTASTTKVPPVLASIAEASTLVAPPSPSVAPLISPRTLEPLLRNSLKNVPRLPDPAAQPSSSSDDKVKSDEHQLKRSRKHKRTSATGPATHLPANPDLDQSYYLPMEEMFSHLGNTFFGAAYLPHAYSPPPHHSHPDPHHSHPNPNPHHPHPHSHQPPHPHHPHHYPYHHPYHPHHYPSPHPYPPPPPPYHAPDPVSLPSPPPPPPHSEPHPHPPSRPRSEHPRSSQLDSNTKKLIRSEIHKQLQQYSTEGDELSAGFGGLSVDPYRPYSYPYPYPYPYSPHPYPPYSYPSYPSYPPPPPPPSYYPPYSSPYPSPYSSPYPSPYSSPYPSPYSYAYSSPYSSPYSPSPYAYSPYGSYYPPPPSSPYYPSEAYPWYQSLPPLGFEFATPQNADPESRKRAKAERRKQTLLVSLESGKPPVPKPKPIVDTHPWWGHAWKYNSSNPTILEPYAPIHGEQESSEENQEEASDKKEEETTPVTKAEEPVAADVPSKKEEKAPADA